MALVLLDRAQETATANTTVSFTLLGASTGYQSLAGVGNGNTTYYGATDGTNWEVGIGTYSTTGPTLTRTTILTSSNSNLAVTFSGTVTVFVDYPSGKSVYQDGTGAVTGYTISGGTVDNAPIGGSVAAAGTFTTLAASANPTNTVPGVSISGTPNGATGGKTGVLAVGSNFTASDKNIMATFVQDINDYTQIIVQNPNAGTAASADFVVNNDNTTGSGVYGDFGINSSGFSGTGALGAANSTYLYANGGDLAIGTTTANAVRFATNSSATDAMTISSAGVVSLGTALAVTSGGTGKTTAPAAYNNLFGYSSTSTAGGTTTLTNASSIYQVFTGTQVQTVQLPATSTLTLGSSFHIANSSTGVLTLNTATSVLLTTIAPGATVMVTSVSTSVDTAAGWELGFTDFSVDSRQVPQNAQTGNYTLTTTDYGKHIYHAAAAAAATYTIPANASVPFEIGTTITFVNMSTNNVTIAITTDTMYLAGTGTTGSRTLAQYGMATALKMTATTWIISGSALT